MGSEGERDGCSKTIADGGLVVPGELTEFRVPLSVRKRLELQTLHSSGGIGEVWLAYDGLLKREVALKRLKPEQGEAPRNRARFSREARITGQLNHPGIVPVYDYSPGDDGGHHFYTMRFVRGRTLRSIIKEFHEERAETGEPLVGPKFLQLLRDFISVCETVAFAHSRRVIHRDLKGDNVVVGEYGEVVVLDWGLAKLLDDDEEEEVPVDSDALPPLETGGGIETRYGDQLGTPAYMAPEQALGLNTEVGMHSDVHCLAAILYEILTGDPPYLREDVPSMISASIRDAPTPPRERIVDVPPELEAVCLQGLQKAPASRPESARALGGEVQRWVDALAERKRTEQDRERFFRLSGDLLAIVDPHGRLVQSNPAWSDVLGLDDEARRDADFASLLDEDHRDAAAAVFASAYDKEGARRFDARMRHVDGSVRWINWSVRTVENASTLYLVGRDVTELVRSQHRFRGLLEAAPDPSCVTDDAGRIELVNRTLEVLSGYSRDELIGQNVDVLVPEEHRRGHGNLLARYIADPFVRPIGAGRPLSLETKSGEHVRVEVSLGPMRDDDGGLLVVCSIRPVDEQRRTAR